ncbi:MAG: hypothetical protein ACTS73_05860 [Arsenophonus sp. NEOnobi-MAG3]
MEILEEFNADCVSRFLELIIDKECMLCLNEAKWYETFARKHEISYHCLIKLHAHRVIGKEFHIQNLNSYITRLKRWVSKFYGVRSFYLPNYLAWIKLFKSMTIKIQIWL